MAITLRPVDDDGLRFLWHWNHNVADPAWRQFDGPYFDRPEPQSFDEFASSQAHLLSSPNHVIIHADSEPVGILTRYEEDPIGGGWWELGIVIFDPANWSRGIGSQALRMWTTDTFSSTNAHLITLTTWSGNERMIRSANKLGFRECARMPEARLYEGTRYDSVKMCVLRQTPEHTDHSLSS